MRVAQTLLMRDIVFVVAYFRYIQMHRCRQTHTRMIPAPLSATVAAVAVCVLNAERVHVRGDYKQLVKCENSKNHCDQNNGVEREEERKNEKMFIGIVWQVVYFSSSFLFIQRQICLFALALSGLLST